VAPLVATAELGTPWKRRLAGDGHAEHSGLARVAGIGSDRVGTGAPTLRFDGFEIDVERLELRRDGEAIRTPPRVVELLVLLATSTDRVMTRSELHESLWPGRTVGQTALSKLVRSARHAVGDSLRDPRLIQTVRGRGLRFGGNASFQAPILGREKDLARLNQALAGAIAGQGQVAVVAGEAGIGKTRFAEEVMSSAKSQGFCVLRAAPLLEADPDPLSLWNSILAGLVSDLDDAEIATLLGPDASVLAQAFPALESRVSSDRPPRRLGPDHARLRLFRAVIRLVTSAMARRPLLLVLEDLHWVDDASLALIDLLLPEVKERPILILVTYRCESVGHKTRALLMKLTNWTRLTQLELTGLPEERVAELVRWTTGSRPSEERLQEICRRTSGNPLFVRQLALSEQETGEDGGVAVGDTPLARSSLIAERLRRLSPDGRRLLELGALAKGDFSAPMLSLASDLEPDRVRRELVAAVRAGLLKQTHPDRERYGFVHALVRDAVFSQLLDEERAEGHERLGEALEALYPEPRLSDLEALAYNFGRATSPDARRKALDYGRQAGERWMSLLQYGRAAARFERVVELLGEGGHPEARYEALVAWAKALVGIGRIADSREVYANAMEIARGLEDWSRFAQAALGVAARPLSMSESTRPADVVAEALELLPEREDGLRARLLARQGEALSRLPRYRERADELLRRAQGLGDDAAQCEALLARCRVLTQQTSPDRRERVRLADEASVLAQRVGDETAQLEAMQAALNPLLELGEFEAADARLEGYADILARLRLTDYAWQVPLYRAMRACFVGDFDRARVEFERTRQVTGDAPLDHWDGDSYGSAHLAAAQLLWMREKDLLVADLAKPLASGLRALHVHRGVTLGLLAGVQLEAGRWEAARRVIGRWTTEDLRGIQQTDGSWVGAAAVLAEICSRLDDPARAGTLYEMLSSESDYWIVGPDFAGNFGPATLYLGMCATTVGDWAASEEHLEDALARCEAAGATPWRARTLVSLARCRLRREGPGDPASARALLQHATRLAKGCGMTQLLRVIRQT